MALKNKFDLDAIRFAYEGGEPLPLIRGAHGVGQRQLSYMAQSMQWTRPPGRRECPVCSADLSACSDASRVYCSLRCRKSAHRSRRRPKWRERYHKNAEKRRRQRQNWTPEQREHERAMRRKRWDAMSKEDRAALYARVRARQQEHPEKYRLKNRLRKKADLAKMRAVYRAVKELGLLPKEIIDAA